MSDLWIDITALYWLVIKITLYASALIILISGIDDSFFDIYYWIHKWSKKKSTRPVDINLTNQINELEEKPIAVMIPAWQEWPVIDKMAKRAASTFDYQLYHIFIGTYPNDELTQEAVDLVVATYPNVHKVVTDKPGPTTKADCLNNVIKSIQKFEKDQFISFEIIAYHDAEDVTHPLELKLYNFFIPENDLIQLPVFPLARSWKHFTGNHYMDEFGEVHIKDMLVREAMTGNVPSAGVGTAFSRKAINYLHDKNKGVVFATDSLTEDYEIAYELTKQGMKEKFVLFPIENSTPPYVSVKGFFPAKLGAAIRQKSRWIIGIVFQARKKIGWPPLSPLFYVLLRDRKALITVPTMLLAYFVFVNVVIMEIYTRSSSDTWWFPSLVPLDSWIWPILYMNGFFMINRLYHRFHSTSHLYGFKEGLLSVPRTVVGNIINIGAFFRALKQVFSAQQTGKKLSWDKTDHEFPDDDH